MRRVFLVLALALSGPALAQGSGNAVLDGVLSAIEKRIIRDHFQAQPVEEAKPKGGEKGKGNKGLPPGLAKKNGLPPGLAKRQTLPPGLAKRDLPPGLAGKLPATKPGQQRIIVDNDVVLIERATGVILDILEDVVSGQ